MDLPQLRACIDRFDALLLMIIGMRQEVAKEIAQLKEEAGLPTHDPEREKQHLHELIAIGEKEGVSPEDVTDILTVIMTRSRVLQDKVRQSSGTHPGTPAE